MNERDRVQILAEQEVPQPHRGGGISQALSSENHDAAVAYCYDGYNQRAHEEVPMTMRSAMTGTEGNDADPKVAYGINPAESGMMIGTNPPAEETAHTLRKSPGGENGVIQMNRQNAAIERDYKEKIHLRKATLCNHRCEECRFCQYCGDEDGGEYVWCRHPHTLSLPDFFNIMEENMVCNLFEPCPGVQTVGFKAWNMQVNAKAVRLDMNMGGDFLTDEAQTIRSGASATIKGGVIMSETIGFKAGQPADGGLGDEREVSPTLSHKPSALESTLAQSQCDLSQMRYIVRRLTPTEAERLMGLPDGYLIPTGLRRYFDENGEPPPELVKKPPKGKSYNQVAAWLKKISDPATCPDSPMYKAAGNGWATNQPRWILTRLLAIGEHIDPFTGEEDAPCS